MNKAQKEKIARKLRTDKGLSPKLKGDLLQKNIARTYNRQHKDYNDAQDKLWEVRKANKQ